MDILVREATLFDIEHGAFYECLRTLSPELIVPQRSRDIFISRLNAGIITLVAEIDNKVVGTGSILIERKFIHGSKAVGHIEDVAVLPDYQRKGIGKALIEKLVEFSLTRDCYKVILNSSETNREFYEKLGFYQKDLSMRKSND